MQLAIFIIFYLLLGTTPFTPWMSSHLRIYLIIKIEFIISYIVWISVMLPSLSTSDAASFTFQLWHSHIVGQVNLNQLRYICSYDKASICCHNCLSWKCPFPSSSKSEDIEQDIFSQDMSQKCPGHWHINVLVLKVILGLFLCVLRLWRHNSKHKKCWKIRENMYNS